MFPDSDGPLLVLGQVQEDSPPWASRFPSVGFWRVFKFLYIYIYVCETYIYMVYKICAGQRTLYIRIYMEPRMTHLPACA